MTKKQVSRNTSPQADRKARVTGERPDFVSFAVAPEGKVQQSPFERKWAAYQPWAAAERPDHCFGPCLTPEAGRR